MDISAHSTSQRISVPMLVSGIVGCALHNVERHPGGIDECRPAHLFTRKIVIPHLSVHHDTVGEPIERLHASSNVHRPRCLVVVHKTSRFVAEIYFCIAQMSNVEACQSGCVRISEPCVALFEKQEIFREQTVLCQNVPGRSRHDSAQHDKI